MLMKAIMTFKHNQMSTHKIIPLFTNKKPDNSANISY